MKINVHSLTRFSLLGKLLGPPRTPKIKIGQSDTFKSSKIKIFLRINQVFVVHRVKLKELKNEKKGAIMTLIVQRKV